MSNLSSAQIYAAAKAGGFTASESVIATAIALAESSGNPSATHHNSNGSTDYGLWQINSVHGDLLKTGDWRDPATNARMAHTVYMSQGWHAWSTYNSGAYSSHLPSPSTVRQASNTAVPAGFWGDLGKSLIGGPTAGLPKNLQPDILGSNPGGVKPYNPLSGLDPFGIKEAVAFLFDPMRWERIGFGALGFVLVVLGFVLMVDSNKTVSNLTKAAAKVAVA